MTRRLWEGEGGLQTTAEAKAETKAKVEVKAQAQATKGLLRGNPSGLLDRMLPVVPCALWYDVVSSSIPDSDWAN